MGCRRGTVKALLHKARQQLQLGLHEERVSWGKRIGKNSKMIIKAWKLQSRCNRAFCSLWSLNALGWLLSESGNLRRSDLGVAGMGILQFQPLESKQVSKLSACSCCYWDNLPKHPQDSSVWLGMSKPALRSLAITRPRLSSRSLRPSSRFLLGSRPRKGSWFNQPIILREF